MVAFPGRALEEQFVGMSQMEDRQMTRVRIDKVANVSNSVIHVHPAHQPTTMQVNARGTVRR